jgi:threonine dehydrogenase-like Zn-dependent dehydrogenase
MRGLIFLGGREVALREFPDPVAGPGDVVLAIKASGMCGSDLHSYRAAPDPARHASDYIIGGHEPAGIVTAVGPGVPGTVAQVGDRVMVHHYRGCGACTECRSGWSQLCTTGEMGLFGGNRHGAHAPYMTVPAATLLPLPASLSFSAGAAIACGTGTAWGGLRRLQLTGRETIVIVGQGPVGLSATMLAAAQGARVIALDISAERLGRSARFGAWATINPAQENPVEAILALTGGRGAELALETSGSTRGAADALAALGVWGRACFLGIGAQVHFDVKEYMARQVTVMTSWSMSSVGQLECADFVVKRGIEVDQLFTDRWNLEEAVAAYAKFDQQSAGKGVFLP